MQIAVIAVVLLVLGSLFIERAPAGGLRISRRFVLLREFTEFIRERKLWWMTPIFIILITLGVVLVMTEKAAIGPLIYTLF